MNTAPEVHVEVSFAVSNAPPPIAELFAPARTVV
jgi:hypothetical protein